MPFHSVLIDMFNFSYQILLLKDSISDWGGHCKRHRAIFLKKVGYL